MFRITTSPAAYSNSTTRPAVITHRPSCSCMRRSRGSGMPSRIAATAADIPLSYQSFKKYAQESPDKTACHRLMAVLSPEIWVFGTGQARNRTARAVERTVPFQLACQAITTIWYATAGHDPADVDGHRHRAPWYTAKAQPSTADMAGKLRRVVIAARFKASRPDQPTPEEISAIRLAWEDLAA